MKSSRLFLLILWLSPLLLLPAVAQADFLYSANSGGFSIGVYRINATTGGLTLVESDPANGAPSEVAVHPSGNFLYSADSGGHTIGVYRINATTGALTLVESDPASGAPSAVAVHPTGKFLYSPNGSGNA